MARRHLPVIASEAPTPTEPTADDAPPPWHWIPLGTAVSVLTFALLAPGANALGRGVLGHFYRGVTGTRAMLALRAQHPAQAMVYESTVGALALATLTVAIALGGYVIGRYGATTNTRHGTLSGIVTAALFWAVTRMLPVVLVAVPLGGIAGGLGALAGIVARDRRA